QHGTLANGAPCVLGLQCTSGYCAVPAQSSCGTCADDPKPFGDLGAPCDVNPCDWPLACVWNGAAFECRKRVAGGAACSGGAEPSGPLVGTCQSLPLACVGTPSGGVITAGVCTHLPTSGSACMAFGGALCDIDATCDTQTMKCVDEKIVSAGDA